MTNFCNIQTQHTPTPKKEEVIQPFKMWQTYLNWHVTSHSNLLKNTTTYYFHHTLYDSINCQHMKVSHFRSVLKYFHGWGTQQQDFSKSIKVWTSLKGRLGGSSLVQSLACLRQRRVQSRSLPFKWIYQCCFTQVLNYEDKKTTKS